MREVCKCGEKTVLFADQDGAMSADPSPAMTAHPSQPKPATRKRRQSKGPNKTEAEYRRLYLDRIYPPARILYEAITLRLANGHRYTPDWVVLLPDGQVECHEVKGAYRLGSLQRARLAFDQARIEWPAWRWVWATRGKGGAWEVEGANNSSTGQEPA